ncbi:hypothetical protein Tco_0772645 [Tanacetum coccineum]|uniref:Uncharacterized protein n=1 Tax=Tanacetum coccineum TaxID=301880 RepID=A0ABQ4ZIG6_9ASTR
MMTVRKRVGLLLTHRLAVRHSVDYSSSDHFYSDDSSRDSSSSSSSETSSDSSADALSDFASSRSSYDHSLPVPSSSSGMRPSHHLCSIVPSIPCSSTAISDRPSHDSSSASPSRKSSRSLATSVSLSSPTLGALSYAPLEIEGLNGRVVVGAMIERRSRQLERDNMRLRDMMDVLRVRELPEDCWLEALLIQEASGAIRSSDYFMSILCDT